MNAKKLMYFGTKALRNDAEARIHAEAKKKGVRIKTEKISPTRFIVSGEWKHVEEIVHQVAADLQRELRAKEVEGLKLGKP